MLGKNFIAGRRVEKRFVSTSSTQCNETVEIDGKDSGKGNARYQMMDGLVYCKLGTGRHGRRGTEAPLVVVVAMGAAKLLAPRLREAYPRCLSHV